MSFSFTVTLILTTLGLVCCNDPSNDQDRSTLSPILIITGFGGSRLSVQDMREGNCNTNGETVNIWTNATYIRTLPMCFLEQIRPDYNNGSYDDPPGVQVLTPDFGSVTSLANFSDIVPSNDDPDIVQYFLQRGYTSDVNIRAAPYDWRLGADQLNERGYYTDLKQLVEQMYRDNGNTKVTLVVVSMGGPVSLYFLTQVVNQEWKDTYIHGYISLAAAWAGVNGVISSILTPPSNPIFFFYPIEASTDDLRSISRDFPSYYFLSLKSTSPLDETVIVSTPTRNYTVNDYQQLYIDAGFPEGYTRFIEESNMDFPSPNVPTYCFYGLGIPTPETFAYDGGFPDTQPTIINGEGDGAVNRNSLEVCLRWANGSYPFKLSVFPGVFHANIVTDEVVLQSIGEIVGAPRDPIVNGVAPLTTAKQLFLITVIVAIAFGAV